MGRRTSQKMMDAVTFGWTNRQRKKKRRQAQQRERGRVKEEQRVVDEKEMQNVSTPAQQADNVREQQQQVSQLAEEEKAQTEKDRAEAEARARERLSRDTEGISNERKTALTEQASRNIANQREMENRRLQSEAGRRGLTRGDTALQMKVARQSQDAMGAFNRDLIDIDQEVALQKLAAEIALEQGDVAAAAASRARYTNLLSGLTDKEKGKKERDYYNKYV